jgi:integrase
MDHIAIGDVMRGAVDSYQRRTRHPRTGRYEAWRIRWELPPDPVTGKRRRGIRRGFATRKEAEAELANILGKVNSGVYVTPSRQPLAAYLTDWLAGLRVKPTTLDNYRTCAEVHVIPRLGGIRLSELTTEQVDRLYRDLEKHGKKVGPCRTAGTTCRQHGCQPDRHDGLAPKSVWHVHVMLRKALEDARLRGYIGRNVCDQAHPPRQRDTNTRGARDKAWTTDQLRAFLTGSTNDRMLPLWHLAATTGLRRAELCGVRWTDLDLDRSRLHVTGTITEVRGRLIDQDDGKSPSASRSLALDGATVAVLRRWRVQQAEDRLAAGPAWRDTGLVFTRLDGTAHRPKRLSSTFTTQVDLLGLPRIGLHGLRHTYATAALRAGVSPEIVSRRLGHSSVIITLTLYAHVFEQDDQAAADRVAELILSG